MITMEEAARRAAPDLAKGRAERDALSPRQAAEAAWHPDHELGTVDAIEALIIQQRAQAEEQWRLGIHPYQLDQQQPLAA